MKSSKSLSVYDIDWRWCNENGMAFDSGDEQYSTLPRAIADENACPHKSIVSSPFAYAHDHAKVFTWFSMWAAKKLLYRKAAKSLHVSTAISHCWHVTIDAMFMIHSKPLRRTATTVWFDCIRLLYHQFLQKHFKMGTVQAHLVFDNLEMHEFNPNQFEQTKGHTTKVQYKQKQHHSFAIFIFLYTTFNCWARHSNESW